MILQGSSTISMSMRAYGNTAPTLGTLFSFRFLISVSQIGELVSKISPETCRRYFPDIEWQQIRGMRNIIVHVYANVDYDIVWDVVNEEAPKLKQTLLKNDDIRREYESTLVVEEDIEEDILGYFGALDPIVGDGADGRIPQDGNRP